MRSLVQLRYGAVALAAICVAGCENAGRPVVPVKGLIAFSDGRPLPTGTRLMFNPGDGKTETGIGITDAEGNFEPVRVSGRKGLAIGKYTILIRAPEGVDRNAFFKTIPNEYYDGGVLNADVQEGMAPLQLKVQSRKR